MSFTDELDAIVQRTEQTHAAVGIDVSTCYLCRRPIGDSGHYCLWRGLSVVACDTCWEYSFEQDFMRWCEEVRPRP